MWRFVTQSNIEIWFTLTASIGGWLSTQFQQSYCQSLSGTARYQSGWRGFQGIQFQALLFLEQWKFVYLPPTHNQGLRQLFFTGSWDLPPSAANLPVFLFICSSVVIGQTWMSTILRSGQLSMWFRSSCLLMWWVALKGQITRAFSGNCFHPAGHQHSARHFKGIGQRSGKQCVW